MPFVGSLEISLVLLTFSTCSEDIICYLDEWSIRRDFACTAKMSKLTTDQSILEILTRSDSEDEDIFSDDLKDVDIINRKYVEVC